MTGALEAPDGGGQDWSLIYRSRGNEVTDLRPVFTGDVFKGISLVGDSGKEEKRSVIIVQHPCAMRTDGVELTPRVLVAEVRQHRTLEPAEWQKFGKMMPLPDLYPDLASARRNHAAFFDKLFVVTPNVLSDRVACLSQLGVNLLMQRWVYHNSRVIIDTFKFDEAISGVYEECDLLEDWCAERAEVGVAFADAAKECVDWLREAPPSGSTRQDLLKQPQNRSAVRRAMRAHLKRLSAG